MANNWTCVRGPDGKLNLPPRETLVLTVLQAHSMQYVRLGMIPKEEPSFPDYWTGEGGHGAYALVKTTRSDKGSRVTHWSPIAKLPKRVPLRLLVK